MICLILKTSVINLIIKSTSAISISLKIMSVISLLLKSDTKNLCLSI